MRTGHGDSTISGGEVSLGFGLRASGDIVLMHQLLPEEYGNRCNLFCPECGAPLQAVRRLVGGEFAGWKCLRHAPGASLGCCGYGEKSSHMLAEELFARSLGDEMVLPPVSALDAIPHISRVNEHGRWRPGREGTHRYGDDAARMWPLGEELVPDVEVLPAQRMRVVNVRREVKVADGLIADLVVTLGRIGATDGRHADVAVEIRYTHQKDLEHVMSYMEAGMSVIEILVRDITVDDADAVERLRRRLLGTAASEAGDPMREWLWNKSAMRLANKAFHLSWTIDDEHAPREDGTGVPVTSDAVRKGCAEDLWRMGYRDVTDDAVPPIGQMARLMSERHVPVSLIGCHARTDGHPYCRYYKSTVAVGFVSGSPSRPKESLYHASDLMRDVRVALDGYVRRRGKLLHGMGY